MVFWFCVLRFQTPQKIITLYKQCENKRKICVFVFLKKYKGADISWLSEFSREKEYLMLPMKVCFKEFNTDNSITYYPTTNYESLDIDFSCYDSIFQF